MNHLYTVAAATIFAVIVVGQTSADTGKKHKPTSDQLNTGAMQPAQSNLHPNMMRMMMQMRGQMMDGHMPSGGQDGGKTTMDRMMMKMMMTGRMMGAASSETAKSEMLARLSEYDAARTAHCLCRSSRPSTRP